MGAKKIKVRKKDSERADELLGKTGKIADWAVSNVRLLGGAAIGVVVVLLCVWGFNLYGESKESRALKEYVQVREKWKTDATMEEPVREEAIKGLKAVVDGYPGTKIARLARMDLGNLYFDAGNYEDAAHWYQATRDHLEAKELLAAMAAYDQGMAYYELGKMKDALTVLQTLEGSLPESFTRDYNCQLARIFAATGDYGKAVERYNQAMEAAGSYPPKGLIEEELAAAKIKLGDKKS